MRKRSREDLVSMFESLGEPDADWWADAELNSRTAFLAQYVFLRAAWKQLVAEDNVAWIDDALRSTEGPTAPGAGLKPALKRLLEKGCDPSDITEVVRVMQWRLLFDLCSLLTSHTLGREDLRKAGVDVDDVAWCLYECDPRSGKTRRPLGALHEDVLGFDPTGREMRPR